MTTRGLNAVERLFDRLKRENPRIDWICEPFEEMGGDQQESERVLIIARCEGAELSHSPLTLSMDMIDRLGIDSAAYLIAHEVSPKRVGINWDKLAEI
ncbi:MAG: hypothetical protein SFY81_12360 [Verrucomicrobiota bacterium]|nr:hypothetical protein [Verrucomicrobiota bacterium]